MKKNKFNNMAWLFVEDIVKDNEDCWTEEKKEGSSKASEVPKFRASMMDAIKVSHPAMDEKDVHAEILVEQRIMPQVAAGTWAGEAFGPGQEKLWNEYGQDMGSGSSLR